MSGHIEGFYIIEDGELVRCVWPRRERPTHVLVKVTDPRAVEPIGVQRLVELAYRLEREADHLDAHPGSIIQSPYGREQGDTSADAAEVRKRYKVIHATHTVSLLRGLAAEFRQLAEREEAEPLTG